jgi:hypothetical protein
MSFYNQKRGAHAIRTVAKRVVFRGRMIPFAEADEARSADRFV